MTYLFHRLRAALAAWDILLLLTVCIVIYYEGTGPLRDLRYVGPLIAHVPLIGDLVEGRVGKAERAGREAGAAAERAEWEELRRRAEISTELARAAAQAAIDAAEAERIAAEQSHAEQLDDLNDIIDQERTRHAVQKDTPGCAPMPERVRTQLNAIGAR